MTAEVMAAAGISIATELIIGHKQDEIMKSATFLENLRAWFGVPKSLTPTIAAEHLCYSPCIRAIKAPNRCRLLINIAWSTSQ
jgi:hypothetical protein